MPTGFIVSKLVEERYRSYKDRDDESLYSTLDSIRTRLILSLDVYHPILSGERISDGKEAAMEEMRERIGPALEELSVLNDPQCTRQTALKAWKKFFNHDYFEDALKSECASVVAPTIIASQEPERPVERHGKARFG